MSNIDPFKSVITPIEFRVLVMNLAINMNEIDKSKGVTEATADVYLDKVRSLLARVDAYKEMMMETSDPSDEVDPGAHSF